MFKTWGPAPLWTLLLMLLDFINFSPIHFLEVGNNCSNKMKSNTISKLNSPEDKLPDILPNNFPIYLFIFASFKLFPCLNHSIDELHGAKSKEERFVFLLWVFVMSFWHANIICFITINKNTLLRILHFSWCLINLSHLKNLFIFKTIKEKKNN